MKPQILLQLLSGYEDQDISLNCGMIMRECIRQESLCKLFLGQEFWRFFDFVELSTFDIASGIFLSA